MSETNNEPTDIYNLSDNLIRELRDKIKADVEKEVYGLTAGRGRDMKVRVDRLEGEVESLHGVIKLKDDRLTWWRQTVDGKNREISELRKNAEKEEAAIDSTWTTSTAIRTTLHQRDRRIEELRGIISERNSTIDSLQGRLNDLDPTLPT